MLTSTKFNDAKPMPIKRTPPLTSPVETNGGGVNGMS